MTEAPERPVVPVVVPAADSRLEQLVSQFEQAKAEAKAAEDRLEGIKAGIKAELMSLEPHAQRIRLRSEYLTQPYRVMAKTSWRIDQKALKRDDPHTYVRYAYQSTSWYLEVDR